MAIATVRWSSTEHRFIEDTDSEIAWDADAHRYISRAPVVETVTRAPLPPLPDVEDPVAWDPINHVYTFIASSSAPLGTPPVITTNNGVGGNTPGDSFTINLGLGAGTGASGLHLIQTPGATPNVKTVIANTGILVSTNAASGPAGNYIQVSQTITDPTGSTQNNGIGVQMFASLSAPNNTSMSAFGGYIDTGSSTNSLYATAFGQMIASGNEAHVKLTGGQVGGATGGGIVAVSGNVESDVGATATIVNAYGGFFYGTLNGATPTTLIIGTLSNVTNNNTATVTTAISHSGRAHVNSGGGAITNAISVHADDQTVGTSNISVYVGSTGSLPGGNWGIYQQSTKNNRLNANLTIATGGLTVTAGGVTVTAGGITVVTGGATFTQTDTSLGATVTQLSLTETFNPGGPSTATVYSARILFNIQGGGNGLSGTLYGLDIEPLITNTGTSTNIIGIQVLPQYSTAGTIATLQGIRSEIFNTSTGAITGPNGLLTRVQNNGTGTVGVAYGYRSLAHINSGGGTFTAAIGIAADVQTVGTRNIAILVGGDPGGTANTAIYCNSTLACTFSGPFYLGSPALATQGVCSLFAGLGAPSNTNGNNGDIYFRSDGGALTTVYQKRAGSWTGIV